MTEIATEPTGLATPVDAPPLASWSRRVVAALLDGAILSGATWVVLGSGGLAPELTPTWGAADTDVDAVGWFTSPWLVGLLLAMLVLQGWTGATPGKRVAGVAVVRVSDGLPAGFLASAVRVLAHLLDAILLIGYFRPLWNVRRQTFADSIVGTLAIQTREPPAHPWFARSRREPSAARSVTVSVAAGAVCLLGVGFSTSTSSWGGEWESAVPCTVDGTVVDPTAHADAARIGGSRHEQRLWISRKTEDVRTGLRLRWTWSPADEAVRGATVVTDLERADGSVIEETQEVTVSAGGPDTVVFEGAEIPVEDLQNAGPGWTAQSRLVVDGEALGSCTVDAADWEDAGPPSWYRG